MHAYFSAIDISFSALLYVKRQFLYKAAERFIA